MNFDILNKDAQQFIADNFKVDITKLILKGSPFDNILIQDLAHQIVSKEKCEKKLPSWFATEEIYYPPKVNIEQTSSEITAKYKSEIINGDSIIDITGGFGVDCYYFSKKFKQVIHCEINEELSKIVTHNYQKLQVNNIDTISGNGFDYLKNTNKTFDCIYVDPSRRSDVKGKVFLLKDCLPYIPPKINFYFSRAKHILVKVSPILDISNTINDLQNVKEVHIVAINNEVKELLFLLEKDFESSVVIKTINFKKTTTEKFSFPLKDEVISNYSEPLSYLYEPNAAILKSGGFHQVTNKLNVSKLHQHSHLYTSDILLDFPGRKFKIEAILPYDKKQIKKLIPSKKANFTIRNFPKNVAQLRKETKIKEGGSIYVFFTKNINNELTVLICKKT